MKFKKIQLFLMASKVRRGEGSQAVHIKAAISQPHPINQLQKSVKNRSQEIAQMIQKSTFFLPQPQTYSGERRAIPWKHQLAIEKTKA